MVDTSNYQEIIAVMVQEQFCSNQNKNAVIYPAQPSDPDGQVHAVRATRNDNDKWVLGLACLKDNDPMYFQ
jgi:hypothetical protein